MKATFVSSSAVSGALRQSLLRMQSELVKAQTESATGRHADVGLALGSKTGQVVSFRRDMDRLGVIVDSNQLAGARLTQTQNAMSQVTTVAQNFLQTLMAGSSGDASQSVIQTDAKGTSEALTSILNSAYNGEYLFAGINTDVKPINNFSDPGSPAKAALDAAFLAHFGFTQSSPAAAGITGAQMNTFLTTVVEPQFMGAAGWSADWSNASDDGITTRIALNETAQTSVSANEEPLKRLIVMSAIVSDLMAGNLNAEARGALVTHAVDTVGQSIAGVADLQSKAGIAENRIKRATERLEMQVDLFERNIGDMEGVDPYEAATRVTNLLTQIETSYALTARIQQLSLVNFLP